MRHLLGDGIFGADDKVWRRQRKAASLEFHSAEFRAPTASSLVELVHHRLLPCWPTRMRDEDGRPYTDKFLRDICVNFILASRDTSSVALAWIFSLLGKNPTGESEAVVQEALPRLVL